MRLLRGIFALTLAAAFLTVIGITPALVSADEINVQGTICTAGQLETAIAVASTGDTITFDCDNPEIVFSSWEDQITIDKAITIDGSNSDDQGIILNGSDATNFFVIETGGNVTIQRMTFQNGNTHNTDEYDGTVRVFNSTNEGGAIDIEDEGSLTVIDSTFRLNYADGYGGAIDCNDTDASLTIRGSAFIGNESELDGGAIESWCSLVISQSVFYNNSADTSEGAGGALNVYTGTVEINSSTFSGNLASFGSAINVDDRDDDQLPAEITWSTIYQPFDTAPALYFDAPINLEGVVLIGDGDHCEFDGFNGVLSGDYNLTNDESCDPDNEAWENQTLLLGPLATATVNGVTQVYFPPVEGGPAIDGGPSSCDTDTQPGPDADQLGAPRPNGNGFCDIGAIELDAGISTSTTLCANQWNGQLRMTGDGDDCGRSETFIELPEDGPLTLCVNKWNGSTSMDDYCSRSEYSLSVAGNGSVDVCVNKWNGTLRVSDHCSRSEYADVI